MKKVLIFGICIFLSLTQSYGFSDAQIKIVYNNFVKKIEAKYDLDSEIQIFEILDRKLSEYQDSNLSTEQKNTVSQLSVLHNETLFKKHTEFEKEQQEQKNKEGEIRRNFLVGSTTPPSYVTTLKETGKKIYFTNEKFEFIENNTIKKVLFSKYFQLSNSNVKQFYDKNGVIVKKQGESNYWFVEEFSFQNKIPYSELGEYFVGFVTPELNYTEENAKYYGYVFTKYSYLEDPYGVYLDTLQNIGVDPKFSLLYQDENGRYNFVKDYRKVFLSDISTLTGIPGKEKILFYLKDDVKDGLTISASTLESLRGIGEELGAGKRKQEKIAAVYAWVLDHLQYTRVIDFEDAKIFSGLEGYRNQDGVCTAYTKLSAYLLAFAGVRDVEVLLGDVIDAQDFPNVGHAWLKIGDLYYDPTFDDPIGNTKSRTGDQYRYFALPKDLFYTNRYDRGETPESLKSTTLLYRETRVALSLSKLVEKYSETSYNLLKPFIFRAENNIAYNKDITPENLKNILPYLIVNGSTFAYTDSSGKTGFIRGLNYYSIDNTNTEAALTQLDFKLDGLYLLEWKDGNSTEYRLAYNVKF